MGADFPFKVTVHGDVQATSISVNAGAGQWNIPEEVPIAFVYNRRNYAVMMGTPDNLDDFALGFSLTEEVVKSASDIRSVDIHLTEQGADLRFKVSADAIERLDMTLRRRNMVGASSCGLCGLENVESLFKALPNVADRTISLDNEAIRASMAALTFRQPLNQLTRSVHAAAWVSHNGVIKLIREDVGRHNALDKLLGAMEANDMVVQSGFVLMSSRCSYEIVEKAARRGVQAIVSISGPTAFALRKAKEANMAVYSRLGEGAVRLL